MPDTSLMLVPFPRNQFFVGRDADLLALDEQLQRSPFVTIHAPGGVGKTALALEYAYRFSAHYPCLFWLNASTRESLLADYHQLSRHLELPLLIEQQQAEENQEAAAREQDQPDQFPGLTLPDWLATVRQYLLILDDLQDSALLQEIFPASLAGHILITTRASNLALPQSTTSLDLARLDIQDGAQILLSLSGQTFPTDMQDHAVIASRSAFINLARELSGQPLALTLAGTHIKVCGVSFAYFLQDYRTSLEQVPIFSERHDGFSRELAALVPLFVTFIQQSNARASEILETCAFLASISIPTLLFTSTRANATPSTSVEQQQTDPANSASTGQHQTALDLLLDAGLLTCSRSKQFIYIHPLLQQAIQSMLPQEQQCHRVIQALDLLFYLSPSDENDPASRLRILAHIHHCAIRSNVASAEIAHTFAWAASALEQHNSLSTALFLRSKALEIWGRVPGTNPAALIALRQKQFFLTQRMGNSSKAELLLHQIITDCTAFYGVEHPMTILQLIRLARIYLARRGDEEAEACYKKALALSQRGRDQSDQLVIAIQYELAMFYVHTSDFSSAEFLLRGVYTAFEQQLG